MLAKRWTLAIVVAGLLGTGLSRVEVADQVPDSRAERLRRETDNVTLQSVAPFKVFDNLYYVGVGYVGSWLITTNQGLILIDTLEGAYKDHSIEGIRTLGFDPRNIKYVILRRSHSASISPCTTADNRTGRSCSAAPLPGRAVRPPNSSSRA